jgi:hypothetical protein
MDTAKATENAPRKPGRPRTKAPDINKDYDGFVSFYVTKIAEAPSIDAIEEIFAILDGEWPNLFPNDKTALSEARSIAEDRLAP